MTPYVVPDDPPSRREETLGSRSKFWFERDSVQWLFKASRVNAEETGEPWAEIVAMRCAAWLGLPHACYELATWRGARGVVSRALTRKGVSLVFGNQLLADRDPGYPQDRGGFNRTPRHTLTAVRDALANNVGLPPGEWPVHAATDLFGGYLVLDAWIANADRHHLNWGVLVTLDGHAHLAPTFDHGSALASGITDDQRRERLASGTLATFVARPRVRSPFFRHVGDKLALSPLGRRCGVARVLPGHGLLATARRRRGRRGHRGPARRPSRVVDVARGQEVRRGHADSQQTAYS